MWEILLFFLSFPFTVTVGISPEYNWCHLLAILRPKVKQIRIHCTIALL
jgi:hypothetical protein